MWRSQRCAEFIDGKTNMPYVHAIISNSESLLYTCMQEYKSRTIMIRKKQINITYKSCMNFIYITETAEKLVFYMFRSFIVYRVYIFTQINGSLQSICIERVNFHLQLHKHFVQIVIYHLYKIDLWNLIWQKGHNNETIWSLESTENRFIKLTETMTAWVKTS